VLLLVSGIGTAVAGPPPVIILDPGHGGDDTGVVGAGGLTEGALALDIALRVKRLIDERLGVQTFLTRSDDTHVSLPDRASFANNHHGSLFISIHMGGFPDQKRGGVSLFHFAPPEETAAPAVSALTPWEDQQLTHLGRSESLARILRDALVKAFPDGGEPAVYGLPLYLLGTLEMPAVLIEPAVLTNPVVENQLGREERLEQTAEAIFEATRLYFTPKAQGGRVD
jgi:N-acetylmuramoyl-L-alanine amidase